MRYTIYKKLSALIAQHPGKIILSGMVITIISIILMSQIQMKTNFADMMPDNIPQIKEYKQLIDNYASASTIMIAIESPEKNETLMKSALLEMVGKWQTVPYVKRDSEQELTFRQNWALASGETDVPGVKWDTLNLVKRIDFEMDHEFIEEHAFMSMKKKDLKTVLKMYTDLSIPGMLTSINNNFETEYIDDQDNMASLDGENQAVNGIDGVFEFTKSISTWMQEENSEKLFNAVDRMTMGPRYFFSSDKKFLMLMIQPTVSMNEWDELMALGHAVVDTLDTSIKQKYPTLTFHPAGLAIMAEYEMQMLKEDFGWPSLVALLLILIILIGSFRTWKNPFYSVVSLVISIMWTGGLLFLLLDNLNQMSASFGIILIGLGIDFAIHYMSGFKDGREQGLSVEESFFYMYRKVGSGVVTGGLTTAVVFFTLAVPQFDALTEMGIAVGSGIMVCLFGIMILLPAMIAWDQKGYSLVGNIFRKISLGAVPNIWNSSIQSIQNAQLTRPLKPIGNVMQFTWIESLGSIVQKPVVTASLLILTVVTLYLSYLGFYSIEFEYDMTKQYPDDTPSVIAQNKIIDAYELSPDYAMFASNDLEEVRTKTEKLKKMGERTGLIGRVDAITEFIPPMEEQLSYNRPKIEAFSKKINSMDAGPLTKGDLETVYSELKRLHQNIVEMGILSVMGSGENNKIKRKADQIVGSADSLSLILGYIEELKQEPAALEKLNTYNTLLHTRLKNRLVKMSNSDSITIETLPESLSKRYHHKESGGNLITVYPKDNVWDGIKIRNFSEKTASIDSSITGTPIINLLFIDLISEYGSQALMYGFIAIIIFLLIDFKSIKYTVMAILPLLIGFAWMVGIMALLGMKFDYSSVMALPLIIGIGIDDGVHILHRYKIEGRGSIKTVLHYTGRAILLTSFTTSIGFGSMGLAQHQGIAAMGQTLFIGVWTCFVSSVIIMPALISLVERFTQKKGT
ncbi:MAG: MMPL family transporter [Fibrobacterales bacterium]